MGKNDGRQNGFYRKQGLRRPIQNAYSVALAPVMVLKQNAETIAGVSVAGIGGSVNKTAN
jgi:hypothetical protein